MGISGVHEQIRRVVLIGYLDSEVGLAANARIRGKIYHVHTICFAKVRDLDLDLLPGPLGFQRHVARDVCELPVLERCGPALDAPTLEFITFAGRLVCGDGVVSTVRNRFGGNERNVRIRRAGKEVDRVAARLGGAVGGPMCIDVRIRSDRRAKVVRTSTVGFCIPTGKFVSLPRGVTRARCAVPALHGNGGIDSIRSIVHMELDLPGARRNQILDLNGYQIAAAGSAIC